MNKTIAILAAAIFLLSSCSTSKRSMDMNTPEAIMITDTMWELNKFEGKMIDQSGNIGTKIHFSLNSTNNTVTGYAGCNTFNGSYSLEEGNRISFSRLASTRMACPDADINEREILKVFELADNFTIQDGVLALNVGRRSPLAEFKKATSTEPIVEKYWKLKELEGQKVMMESSQEREVYFMLKTDENRVTGFAGCNSIMGTYSLQEGGQIRFSNMATTMMACPDLKLRESEFLKIFELADNYTIKDDVLNLNVGRRAPLAVFEAIYF